MDVESTTRRVVKKRKAYTPRAVPKNIQQYVRKAITRAAEMKFYDVAISGTASSTTYYTLNLLQIPSGTSPSQRVGDEVRVHRIKGQFQVQPGDNYNAYRIIISANQNNLPNTVGAIGSLLQAYPDPNYDPILMDAVGMVQYSAAVGSGTEQTMWAKNYKIDRKVNWKLKYAGAATANPINRQLWFQFHADSVAIPNPGIYGVFRVYYTDE